VPSLLEVPELLEASSQTTNLPSGVQLSSALHMLPVLLSLQFVLDFQLKYHTQPKWNVVVYAAGTWGPPKVICLVWMGSTLPLALSHLQPHRILLSFPFLMTCH